MSLPKFNLSKLKESVSRQQSATREDIRNLLLLERLQAQIGKQSRANEKKYKSEGYDLYFVISIDACSSNKYVFMHTKELVSHIPNFDEYPLDTSVEGTSLPAQLDLWYGNRGTPILDLIYLEFVAIDREKKDGKIHITYSADLNDFGEGLINRDEIEALDAATVIKKAEDSIADFVEIANMVIKCEGEITYFEDGETDIEYTDINMSYRIL